jgi:hypothetical protein
MDYKNIIVNIGKYHYLIVNSSKSIILSSSNSKSEARQNALDKLQPILNAVLGKHIYLLTIRKISKKDLKSQENDSIKVLGGPIEVSIEKIEVINKNKLKNKGGFGNRRAYFTESFLKKNKEINRNSLEKFAFDYHNKKLKQGPFDVNVIN